MSNITSLKLGKKLPTQNSILGGQLLSQLQTRNIWSLYAPVFVKGLEVLKLLELPVLVRMAEVLELLELSVLLLEVRLYPGRAIVTCANRI